MTAHITTLDSSMGVGVVSRCESISNNSDRQKNMIKKIRRTKKMKGNKIIVVLIALAMVFSACIIVRQNINVQAITHTTIPGVTNYGNATTVLVYNPNVRVSPSFITTGMNASTAYHLYKPSYNLSGGSAALMKWYEEVYTVDASLNPTSTPYTLTPPGDGSVVTPSGAIVLDRAGLWVWSASGVINGSQEISIASYFWVNTSTAYTITIEDSSSIYFGDDVTKTITVKEGDNALSCWVDLLDPQGNTVFHGSATDGTYSFGTKYNITQAGDYTIKAYKDLDYGGGSTSAFLNTYYDETDGTYTVAQTKNQDSGYAGYNETRAYGRNFSSSLNTTLNTTGDYWYYNLCGPWDPPEKNATLKTFNVATGEPNLLLTNTSSIYWGLGLRVDINATNDAGIGITGGSILLYDGNDYYTGNNSGDFTFTNNHLQFAWVNETGLGNYTLEIPRVKTEAPANNYNWSTLTNGSWYIIFYKNIAGNALDEWNSTTNYYLSIESTTPPVRIVIDNDGDSTTTAGTLFDKKVNVPAYVALADTPHYDVLFTIYGTSLSGTKAYYGNDAWEDGSDITIAGDVLEVPTVDNGKLTYISNGQWKAEITPTKPGGSITFTINWEGDDNGSASQTINIINGTYVTPNIDVFYYGDETYLTVTVKDKNDDLQKYSTVYIYWTNSYGIIYTALNNTVGDGVTTGKGAEGQYTFKILGTSTDLGVSAPRNLTIAAKTAGTVAPYEHWGYAMVNMEKKHSMMVNATPTTAYSGVNTQYTISVRKTDGTTIESVSGLNVKLYDIDGNLISGTDGWAYSGDDDFSSATQKRHLPGGVYQVYAYNTTHDSKDHNTTLTITNYSITCSPSVLAWLIDTDTNVTFQVTPTANGTLFVQNMSGTPDVAITGVTAASVPIVNGIGTVESVNATTLGNLTFHFRPTGGSEEDADGLLRVTTATATANPSTIYINEATFVTITITHPATGVVLDDVRVGLDHGKALNETVLAKLPDDAHTDVNGQVTFSVTSEASGDVVIYIENETDPDNEFVITSAARKTMTLDLSDPSVNELGTFTVSAKYNDVLITDATVTIKFGGETKTTSTGTLELTAPAVATTVDYKITATAPGYSTATETIKVVNVPSLKITLTGTKGTDGKYSSPVTVTVSDDTGGLVTGATVTFGGQTLTTVNGQASIAITAETSGVVTATFTGFKDATTESITIKPAGVPGFELLTLVAALGVAFILLRRRQK